MDEFEEIEQPDEDNLNKELLDADKKAIDEAIRILKARFDVVQIFTIRENAPDDIDAWAWGHGNIYTRFGVVREWLS